MEHLDKDDIFLMVSLHQKGKGTDFIAKKLRQDESVVDGVLKRFTKKAGPCIKEKRWQEASFWFLQHKLHILGIKQDYLKYEIALKKCDIDYPYWRKFINDEIEGGNLEDYTEWNEINGRWLDAVKNLKYGSTETEKTQFESKIGAQGGDLIPIEVEELHMDAVCKIVLHGSKSLGSGSLIKMEDGHGIMTCQEFLSDIAQCDHAKVVFEKLDGSEIMVELDPAKHFYTNKELNTTVVACDATQALEANIEPLVKIGDVLVNCPVYSYFHLEGNDKVSIQQKVVAIVGGDGGDQFSFDGTLGDGSIGAPVYCGKQVVGIHHGKEASGNNNAASNMKAIQAWIKQEMSEEGGQKISFTAGEKVLATWTDGFSYNATIIKQTDGGYQVHYYEFGDTFLDQSVDTINKLEGPPKTSSSKPEFFDEEEFQKVCQWLDKNEAGHYKDNFRKSGYDSFDMICKWKESDITLNLTGAGLKPGTVASLHQIIRGIKAYGPKGFHAMPGSQRFAKDPVSKSQKRATKIMNTPMPDEWEPTPSKNELDLTSDFSPEGTSSVRRACQSIMQGNIPSSFKKTGAEDVFYLHSTRHHRYFKIVVKW